MVAVALTAMIRCMLSSPILIVVVVRVSQLDQREWIAEQLGELMWLAGHGDTEPHHKHPEHKARERKRASERCQSERPLSEH